MRPQEEKLAGATLLVFANKQDLPGSLTCEEIRDVMALDKLAGRHWKVGGPAWCKLVACAGSSKANGSFS